MTAIRDTFLLKTYYYHVVEELSNKRAGILLMSIFEYVNNIDHSIYNDAELLSIYESICGDIEYEWSKLNPKTNKYHWNYQGGITSENKSIRNSQRMNAWRVGVFERDNYTCKKCNTKGGILNAHHIKEFALHPDLRFSIDNGLTVCKKCHNKIHSKHG